MTVTKIAEIGSFFRVVRGQNIPRNIENRGSQVSAKLVKRGSRKGNHEMTANGNVACRRFLDPSRVENEPARRRAVELGLLPVHIK